METSELFRNTLKALLKKMPRGAQSRIADELGIERRYLNDFLSGRKMLSESKREEIAEKLGYSYLDFLNLGREIFFKDTDNTISKDNNYVNAVTYDKVFVSILAFSIETLENSISTIFDNGVSIKLSSEIKAKAIISIYNNHRKYTGDFFPFELENINSDILIKAIKASDSPTDSKDNPIDYEDFCVFLGMESPLQVKSQLISLIYLFNSEYVDIKQGINWNIKSKIIDIIKYFKRAA